MAERGKYNPETAKPVKGTLVRGSHRGTLFIAEPGEGRFVVDGPEFANNALGIAGVGAGDAQVDSNFTRIINRLVGREIVAIVEERTGTSGEFRVTDLVRHPEIA